MMNVMINKYHRGTESTRYSKEIARLKEEQKEIISSKMNFDRDDKKVR